MTALAADFNRVRFGQTHSLTEAKQKTGTTIFAGSGVVASAGYTAAATATTALVTQGVAVNKSVNAGADGAVSLAVEQGDFLFANDGGDPVVAADVGALCYWTDDNTVCHTSTGKSAAGKVIALNPSSGPGLAAYTGVVVRVGEIPGL